MNTNLYIPEKRFFRTYEKEGGQKIRTLKNTKFVRKEMLIQVRPLGLNMEDEKDWNGEYAPRCENKCILFVKMDICEKCAKWLEE